MDKAIASSITPVRARPTALIPIARLAWPRSALSSNLAVRVHRCWAGGSGVKPLFPGLQLGPPIWLPLARREEITTTPHVPRIIGAERRTASTAGSTIVGKPTTGDLSHRLAQPGYDWTTTLADVCATSSRPQRDRQTVRLGDTVPAVQLPR